MRTVFVIAAFLVLVGCASAPPPSQPDPSQQVDPDLMQVKADKEIYGLRVDIYRNERGAIGTINISGGASPTAPIFDPWSYGLTGIDTGNGLFLDTNGNLAVDLARLYGIKAPFHIEETVAGLVPYKVTYLFKGSKFQRKGGGDDLPDLVATYSGDEINVSTKDSEGTIYSDSNSVVFTPSGFHLTGKIALKQVSPNRVELEGLLGNGSYIARDVDDADLTSKFSLEFNGKVLTIKLGGAMLGNGASYRYMRTIDGCWFIDPQGNTHDISLQDGTITVRKNGKVERTYKILPTD
jgi:hypothetical protein